MIGRRLEPLLQRALAASPVVLLTGARQVGKSTLAQAVARGAWGGRYLTLDDRTVLDATLLEAIFPMVVSGGDSPQRRHPVRVAPWGETPAIDSPGLDTERS